MTVSSSISKAVMVTDSAVTDYAFPFKAFLAGEISVTMVEGAAATQLNLDDDYTVSGLNADGGGTVSLTAGGAAKAGTGNHLVILRNMEFTQETDYRPNDVFPAETHERALDILKLREQVGRALIAPPDMDEAIQYEDLAALK